MRTPQQHKRKTGWICCLLALFVMGCSTEANVAEYTSRSSQQVQSSETSKPQVELVIDGGTYVPNVKDRVQIDWYEKLTLREALLSTGKIKMNEDGAGIASVVDVGLDSKTKWSVMLNDKEITARQSYDSVISLNDKITVYAKKLDVGTSGSTEPSVTLTIDGGAELNEVSNSYLIPWKQSDTLAGVFAEFDLVKLSEDKQRIVQFGKHELDEKYKVNLKVNGEQVQNKDVLNMTINANDHIILELKPKTSS
ncbi:hypothetical protein NQ117_05955 [Paenibacillus sp. SC116]|uniref:hypothetical protein n=1 Tax=Paenibacillus sp. SC116 TaxID=2968986 RepID=UPI00215A9441|nr:hypothetical protein [Paenibacillus sp. SC116]MCR8843219.1 hypothetical protein [Paenibacillus sp. SC116]